MEQIEAPELHPIEAPKIDETIDSYKGVSDERMEQMLAEGEISQYDYNIGIAKCSCIYNETPKSIADMKINEMKLLDNFINIKNFANFNFLFCYKVLFCKKGIIYNIGSYILLAIIIFHLITYFIFYIKKYAALKKKIKKIRIIRKNVKKEILDVGNF